MTDSPSIADLRPELQRSFEAKGYDSLTDVQSAVLASSQSGKNLRISSQTGSGKTVALGIVLATDLLKEAGDKTKSGTRVIVITPTRELAQQVRDELSWLFSEAPHVRVDVVTGGTSVWDEKRRLRRPPTVLVATPGRLYDHLRSNNISCDSVSQVALDEADRMLDLGFKDDLDAIMAFLPEQRTSHLISATFPSQVRALADRFQGNDSLRIEGTVLGEANTDIDHIAHLVHPSDRYAAVVNLLLLRPNERSLVFVQRRADASDLAERLAGDGFSALPLSGELPQAQRVRTLDAFRSGVVKTIIATDVAARGIDVPDITTVIHFEPPKTPDTYTHRSGRTGRAGRKGTSLLLVPVSAERRIHRLLSAASIDATWDPIPTAEKVKKIALKQSRTELHTTLRDAEVDEGSAEYARSLLDQYDHETLVATLLKLVQSSLPREPAEISALKPRGRGGAYDNGRGEAGRNGGRPSPRKNGAFQTFQINWGSAAGATTAKLLSHVCRRGGIEGGNIGAIRVGPRASTFGVSADVAGQFEENSRRPDRRDPHLKIRVAEGGDAGPPARRQPYGRGPQGRGGYAQNRSTKPGHHRTNQAPPSRNRGQG